MARGLFGNVTDDGMMHGELNKNNNNLTLIKTTLHVRPPAPKRTKVLNRPPLSHKCKWKERKRGGGCKGDGDHSATRTCFHHPSETLVHFRVHFNYLSSIREQKKKLHKFQELTWISLSCFQTAIKNVRH